jgi:hypothetical protein
LSRAIGRVGGGPALQRKRRSTQDRSGLVLRTLNQRHCFLPAALAAPQLGETGQGVISLTRSGKDGGGLCQL